jgi:GTP cyclohydrolase II
VRSSREHKADLTNTSPTDVIGPYPQWSEPGQASSRLDPWGADRRRRVLGRDSAAGYDIRPTIAVTKAHVILPEVIEALQTGRLKADGKFLTDGGAAMVTKVAIEPVWYLPGGRQALRLFRNRPAPRAVRGNRRHVPRAGDALRPRSLPAADRRPDRSTSSATRATWPTPRSNSPPAMHDECNGSDVFGSDICTCRPYLTHAIEECIRGAQRGGVGLVAYSRKEGRALGEVTKFLVYNARKRQVGGDTRRPVFRPHRMRGRRAGHALPGADARRLPLARHQEDPPAGLDEQHEVRRHHRLGHRDRRAGEHPRLD